MKRLGLLLFTIVLLGLLVVGCSQSGDENELELVERSYIDALDREVKIEEIPMRVVSLSPAVTEILFALDLEDRLLGVTDYCNYPEAALDKPKMGDFVNPNIERVVEVEPDLVYVAAGVQKEIVDRFEELGITVFCMDAIDVDHVISNIRMTGEIMGIEDTAAALTDAMQIKVDEVTQRVSGLEKPTVFFEVWDEPLMSAGANTFINNIIVLAGGTNLAGDLGEGFPQISMELLFERDPDVYVANSYHKQGEIVNRPGYDTLTAVRNGRVYTIEDDLITLPGPRVVLGLEEMAHYIHPEAF